MAQPWSFQLYSARNFQPWDKVLQLLGQVGYAQVEGFGGVYGDPAAFRQELDRRGLAMTSGHFAIDLFQVRCQQKRLIIFQRRVDISAELLS